MATFKFVLSKSQHQKKTRSNLSMLMLRYTHKKRVTYFTTHKNIEDKYWDAKNQKVKRKYPGSVRFNILIKKIRQRVEDIANGILIAILIFANLDTTIPNKFTFFGFLITE